jgi:hypothetical protein
VERRNDPGTKSPKRRDEPRKRKDLSATHAEEATMSDSLTDIGLILTDPLAFVFFMFGLLIAIWTFETRTQRAATVIGCLIMIVFGTTIAGNLITHKTISQRISSSTNDAWR